MENCRKLVNNGRVVVVGGGHNRQNAIQMLREEVILSLSDSSLLVHHVMRCLGAGIMQVKVT